MSNDNGHSRLISRMPGVRLDVQDAMNNEETLKPSGSQPIIIGCAGWSLGREYWPDFASDGTHLQRYASRLHGVEINSSFYRPHRQQTYARWADSVRPGFRFCVKMPKQITHVQRLQNCEQLLAEFLAQCSGLGDRLGCLLVQLPPSLAFDEASAETFFNDLRQRFPGFVALEPRHESWTVAEPLLIKYRIAQVAVDPSRISNDSAPRGWPGLKYWRLHGSPRIYHSEYGQAALNRLAEQIAATLDEGAAVFCIFDNTASGAALGNALALTGVVGGLTLAFHSTLSSVIGNSRTRLPVA